MKQDAVRLLELALERGALKYGEFTLSSGQKSHYYFDGRLLSLDPEGAHLIGRLLFAILKSAGVESIGGPTVGADPIVASVALFSHLEGSPISAFIVRLERKAHGTGQAVEGPLHPASQVAIVDDVCTTGGSLIRAIKAAEELNCSVVKVVVLLDRHQGGSEDLRTLGYDFIAILEATPEGQVRVVDQAYGDVSGV